MIIIYTVPKQNGKGTFSQVCASICWFLIRIKTQNRSYCCDLNIQKQTSLLFFLIIRKQFSKVLPKTTLDLRWLHKIWIYLALLALLLNIRLCLVVVFPACSWLLDLVRSSTTGVKQEPFVATKGITTARIAWTCGCVKCLKCQTTPVKWQLSHIHGALFPWIWKKPLISTPVPKKRNGWTCSAHQCTSTANGKEGAYTNCALSLLPVANTEVTYKKGLCLALLHAADGRTEPLLLLCRRDIQAARLWKPRANQERYDGNIHLHNC